MPPGAQSKPHRTTLSLSYVLPCTVCNTRPHSLQTGDWIFKRHKEEIQSTCPSRCFLVGFVRETRPSFLKKILLICTLPVIVASLTLDKCSKQFGKKDGTQRLRAKPSVNTSSAPLPLPTGRLSQCRRNYSLIGRARRGIREDFFSAASCCGSSV